MCVNPRMHWDYMTPHTCTQHTLLSLPLSLSMLARTAVHAYTHRARAPADWPPPPSAPPRDSQAGASAVHFEDQLASAKKCGHLGGKVGRCTHEPYHHLRL